LAAHRQYCDDDNDNDNDVCMMYIMGLWNSTYDDL